MILQNNGNSGIGNDVLNSLPPVFGAIAGAPPAYVSYQYPRTDTLGCNYAAIMNKYVAPLVYAAALAANTMRVSTFANDINHMSVMISNTSTVRRLSGSALIRILLERESTTTSGPIEFSASSRMPAALLRDTDISTSLISQQRLSLVAPAMAPICSVYRHRWFSMRPLPRDVTSRASDPSMQATPVPSSFIRATACTHRPSSLTSYSTSA
jgi:hypothetical protein